MLFAGVHAAPLVAAPIEHWMEKANGFYEQSAYDSASVYYEKIVATGMNNSAVFYNLGNAYYRQNKIGLAILYYERAHRLAPNDPDIAANLRFAKAHLTDRIPEPEKSFLETVLWGIHSVIPLGTQLWFLLGGLVLLSLIFSLGLFASHNGRLWAVYVGCIIAIAVVVEGISAGYKIYRAENTVHAIVLADAVDAVSEPGGSKVLFTVHEGVKFRVRKQLEEWSFVSLSNGVSGWVKNSSLGKI